MNQQARLTKPLDADLNWAVLNIAHDLFPLGFEVSENAPGTWAELNAHLNSGRRMCVFSGGSEQSIFGDPQVNFSFRAWHDLTHWQNQFDFSMCGEFSTWAMQCHYLSAMARNTVQLKKWWLLLHADIVGEKIYHLKRGNFPIDQRAFVEAFLLDPHHAHEIDF